MVWMVWRSMEADVDDIVELRSWRKGERVSWMRSRIWMVDAKRIEKLLSWVRRIVEV